MAISVKTMKFIDRYTGVPICGALTLWKWLVRPASVAKKPLDRVLFIELSEMGSMVAAAPVLKKFKDHHPKTELYFLTFQQNRAALDMLALIPQQQVITIDASSLRNLATTLMSVLGQLRKLKLDAVVDFELFSRISAILAFCVRARISTGFDRLTMEGLYRGKLMTHPVGYNPYTHISINFAALLHVLTEESPLENGLLKAEITPVSPPIPAPPLDTERQNTIWQKLCSACPTLNQESRIVIMNPNAGPLLPIRAWPLERYIETAQQLLQDHNTTIVIMGTDDASDDAHKIKAAIQSERLIDFTSQTEFADIIPLFTLADLIITNDSGPAHFASLTPIAIMVFFGPETPRLYAPISDRCHSFFAGLHCSPCLSAFNHRTTPCTDNQCLKAISVDDVVNQAKTFLQNSQSPARPQKHQPTAD